MGAACFKANYIDDTTKTIDNELKVTKRQRKNEIKLLLLGAGDSGKSTIAKQMKIINQQHWTTEEKLEYREIIHDNILSSMLAIIYGASKFNYTLSDEAKELASPVTTMFPQRGPKDPSMIDHSIVEKLKMLWADSSIQQIYHDYATRLQLPSSTPYMMQSIDRVFQPNYVPSVEDILRARRPTTGIIETEFNTHGVKFKCLDVGGQRTERRKWLHCFDDVTAVLFCVAMDEYDMRLYEDETVWRVHESLQLFNEISNSTHLAGASIILFLNKRDLFEKKIQNVDLTITFPEYAGGKEYAKASEYLLVQFASLIKQRERLYAHFTCATDTENITFVFNSIKDTLLTKMLAGAL